MSERRKCEVDGCSNYASFFFLVTVGTFQRKPKARAWTKSVAACDSCCNPHGGNWEAFKRLIGFSTWLVRGELLKSLETQNFDEAATRSEETDELPSPAVVAKGTDARTAQVPSAPPVPDRKSAAAGGE